MPSRLTFSADQRLKQQADFKKVLDTGRRLVRGPLVFFVASGVMSKTRLGIRISRRVGNAVKRNRIKRLIRETFRQLQHEWPEVVDIVISVQPHVVLSLAGYQVLFLMILKLQARRT